ncbi:MAG: VWA domain-containing protein, partial [Defluviitaleaceae bacterium]|nr:VWA domain-containing protein [Defluviitaleaceae bacterium]
MEIKKHICVLLAAMLFLVALNPGTVPAFAAQAHEMDGANGPNGPNESSEKIITLGKTGVSGENRAIDLSSGLEPGEIRTAKSVTAIPDGTFDITLEAIGRRFDTEIFHDIPVQFDVVFALDYSLSMDADNKFDNMIIASVDAINQILANNTEEFYNRVAVVRYASGASTILFDGETWRTDAITANQLPTNLVARTNIMAGMNLSYTLLAQRTGEYADRPAIIVLMTDGQPNGYYLDYRNTNLFGTQGQRNLPTADATEESVFRTIRNMEHIYTRMNQPERGGLEIFTVGFDLRIFTPQQRAFAYAVINPSEIFSDDARSGAYGLNAAGLAIYNNTMDRLRSRLSNFTNPVPASNFQDAPAADLDTIARAFVRIIESMENNDPIRGVMTLVDKIDPAFEIVPGSNFILNGEEISQTAARENGVTVGSDGTLEWWLNDMATLAPSHNGSISSHGINPSRLTFTVRLRDTMKTEENLHKLGDYGRLHTNTNNYNAADNSNPNFASFRPLSNNPFYFTDGEPRPGMMQPDGSVRQNLRATGWARLAYMFNPQPVSVTLQKFFRGDAESFTSSSALVTSPVSLTFQLSGTQGVIQEQSVVLEPQEIIAGMNNREKFVTLEFEIGLNDLANGPFTIRELSSGNIGWSDAREIKNINVPLLGGANGFSVKRRVTNTFNGVFAPEIEFVKEVSDLRNNLELADFSGTFRFRLQGYLDGQAIDRVITVDVENGVGVGHVIFEEFLNGTGVLMLEEISDEIEGMENDRTTHVITMSSGRITGIDESIIFRNKYEEPLPPTPPPTEELPAPDLPTAIPPPATPPPTTSP